MRQRSLTAFVLLIAALACARAAFAQGEGALRVASIGPYERAAAGQIMELRVEGFGERLLATPAAGEFRVQLAQDGATVEAPVRHALPIVIREATPDGTGSTMKPFLALSFVVPRGLRPGAAEVSVVYGQRRSAPAKLTVVERPERPVLGGPVVTSISPAALPPPARAGAPLTLRSGLRFERGAKNVELHVRPLVDPEDDEAGIAVRFRQGGAFYDAGARVVRQERRAINHASGGVSFHPSRDVLLIDVPELLTRGEAALEVTMRAGGQTGDAVSMPVTITDAERAFEAPAEAAPRVLAVAPQRVGAGQALSISVDHRRTLDPDPLQVRVRVESADGRSYTLKPVLNSAERRLDTPADAPVLLVVRPTTEIRGPAQVRLLNPAREDWAGGLSEPANVEIVEEVIGPEVSGVREATDTDLAPLRRMREEQARAGRPFQEYDPAARYLAIQARGLDYHPTYVRIVLSQGAREVTLRPSDFSLSTPTHLIVRLPAGFGPGQLRVSVSNRGARGYSEPATHTLELTARSQ